MHLVLRSDSGESITLEVRPNDTFEDLSNRLYEQGKISVDLKQLSSDSRPFEMTANVMDYFGAKKGIRRKENEEKNSVLDNVTSTSTNDLSSLITTYTSAISSTTLTTTSSSCENSLVTQVSSSNSLPITSSEVKQDPSLDNSNAIVNEKTILDNTNIQLDCKLEGNVEIVQKQFPSIKYCRLCANPIKEEAKFIFDSIESDGDSDSLADIIHESLPILVSKEDELPKQICLSCLECLKSSYAFNKKVSAADELLKKMLYEKNFEFDSSGENEEKCPLCCDGTMKCIPMDETSCLNDDIVQDFNEEDNYERFWSNGDMEFDEYDDYEEDENGYAVQKRRGRPKGTKSSKRQYPWEDVDDEEWTLKEETQVKKRGRPKGSKNKSNQQEQPIQCSLCLTWHSDIPAILAHTLEVHCEDETGTFPCPLCKAIQPDEGELIHHVTNHNSVQPPFKVKMWGCPLCGQYSDGNEELGNHLLADHVQAAAPQYQCPLCDHAPTSGSRLANHITDSHCGPPSWNCPLCDEGHEGKQTVLDHVVRSHVSVAAQTTQCPLCEMQFITDEDMAQHLLERHSTTHIVERPAHFTCSACNARFKTQYNLLKHTCPVRNNKKSKKTYFRY